MNIHLYNTEYFNYIIKIEYETQECVNRVYYPF